MKGQWQVTAWAFEDVAAITAEYIGGTPAPVEEQDGLLLMVKRFTQVPPAVPG